jgi:hypothetical protein
VDPPIGLLALHGTVRRGMTHAASLGVGGPADRTAHGHRHRRDGRCVDNELRGEGARRKEEREGWIKPDFITLAVGQNNDLEGLVCFNFLESHVDFGT